MNLRGHHLLCLYGFKGLGYSKEFIDNLKRILDSLREEHYQQKIQLIDKVDDICKACPFCENGSCLKGRAKLENIDREVLSKIGLEVGSYIKAEKAFKRLKARVKVDDLKKWCSDCQWRELKYCHEGLINKTLP